MLLGFKERFVPMIEDGSKTHTIRAKRQTRPRVGEICHCYTGLRWKGARLLGRWPCVKVENIEIYQRSGRSMIVIVEGVELTPDEKNSLAWRDGFRSHGKGGAFDEMTAFWSEHHGPGAFEGDIIHWRRE